MNADRLYYADQECREFDAEVCTCEQRDRGFAVTLTQTAFYPEGGGQPCDLGLLDTVRVLDVQEENGSVVHLCEHALPVGAQVHGVIDWDRRFDLMQQHSGEHLVSGLIHARYGYHNVGFHMGAEVITIDFDGRIDPDGLGEIESAANEAVWQDLRTEITYPDAETLRTIAYRSKKELSGTVRLVCFPGIDICACCGTHVRSTGQIGLIKLLSCVKFHEGVRVELVCGRRAAAYFSALLSQNREISALLSAKPLETAKEVRRVCEELDKTKYTLGGCREQLFALQAESVRGRGNALIFTDALPADDVRRLTVAGMERCEGICAVFSPAGGNRWNYALGQENGEIRALVKELNTELHGRGGGKPFFAQGSVETDAAEIERFFADRWNGSAAIRFFRHTEGKR